MDTSFAAIEKNIQFIQKNIHKTQHLNPLKDLVFDFSSLLAIVGVGYNESSKIELDKGAHQLMKIAGMMGQEHAKRIIGRFAEPTLEQESGSSLSGGLDEKPLLPLAEKAPLKLFDKPEPRLSRNTSSPITTAQFSHRSFNST